MQYDYKCQECDDTFELSCRMADRDLATETPCKKCGGKIKRCVSAPSMSYDTMDPQTRALKKAGTGWNDVLKGIKKAAGSKSTIETL